MKDFIKWMGILSMLLTLVVGCAVDVHKRSQFSVVTEGTSTTPLVQYITVGKEDMGFIAHVKKPLDYAKIPFKQTRVENFNESPIIAPTARVVVLSNTSLLKPKSMEALVGFVANGGSVILLNITEDMNFGFLAGLKKNPVFSINDQAYGFHFLSSFIPDMKGRFYNSQNKHYGLEPENFSDRVSILATAYNDPAYPVLLEHRIKKGRVLVFNTTDTSQKINRGLYFSAILRALPQVPYPIVNSGVLFLDDFPSPVYNVKEEPISSEFNMTMASFYTEVWWPDMAELARKENLTYTAMACFNYQNKTIPPFSMSEWESNKKMINGKQHVITDWLMRQVRAQGHELALHGYNHVPLLKDNWQHEEYMENSLTATFKKWKAEQYAPMPVAYVPPSNYIDSQGLFALEMAFPSITYLCSTYDGFSEEGGNREFDPDPYNQTFFDFPRISSGYHFDDDQNFTVQSTFLYTGIWSHFIHPDDVYQIKGAETESTRGDFEYRNFDNLGWRKSNNGKKGMLPLLKDHIKKLKATYPMIRFVSVKSGAQETQKWRYQRFRHRETEKTYSVQAVENTKQSPTYWMLYVPIQNWKECEVRFKESNLSYTKTSLHDGYLVMVKSNDGTLSVPKATSINFNQEALSPTTLIAIEEFRNYMDGNFEFQSIDKKIEWLISEGRTPEAIYILKEKIETNDYSFMSELEKLAKYLKFENREFEIWPFLENAYSKREGFRPTLIDLSMRLVENSDYPDLTIKKTWMDRQLRQYPNDADIWDEYTAYFFEEMQNFSPEKLFQLMKNTNNIERKTQYAYLIIKTAPEKFLEFMENQIPCENKTLIPLSTTIAWLYSDHQQYEKAIAWSACSANISSGDVLQWYLLSGDLEYVRKNDFAKYMEYILLNKPTLALEELIDYPECSDNLKLLSTQISYAFANKGLNRKALAWANCSSKIAMSEKLYWYGLLNAIPEMELAYQEYMIAHPFDEDTKYYMAQTYAQMGKIMESWQLASTLPLQEQYSNLRTLLNKEVLYVKREEQRTLINGFPNYFLPEVYQKLQQEYRLHAGSTLRFANEIIADKLRPTAMDNKILYGFLGKGNLKHEIGITQYTARALDVDTINSINSTQTLYGAMYSIGSVERFGKLNYQASARFERSEENKYFYRISALISKSKDSIYASVGASHKPAVTGPAYLLNIYNTQIKAYYENQKFLKKYNLTLSMEANYYTDDVVDGQLTINLGRQYSLGKWSFLKAYSEIAGMLGNTDQHNGFPYWTIKERLYGGGGLDFGHKNPDNHLSFNFGAAIFADTFSDFFQRFRGSIDFPIAPYLHGTAAAEFYTLKDFYSNSFNFGLRYHFNAE